MVALPTFEECDSTPARTAVQDRPRIYIPKIPVERGGAALTLLHGTLPLCIGSVGVPECLDHEAPGAQLGLLVLNQQLPLGGVA